MAKTPTPKPKNLPLSAYAVPSGPGAPLGDAKPGKPASFAKPKGRKKPIAKPKSSKPMGKPGIL